VVGRSGSVTINRLAQALAMAHGIPFERARETVRLVFAAIRDDLEAAQRFVLPGVLIIEKAPDGARKSHRVRFVLRERRRAAERIARYRARQG